MAAFFAPKPSKAKATPGAEEAPAPGGATSAAREEEQLTPQQGQAAPEENPEELLCSRCRRPMVERPSNGSSAPKNVCPFILRLRGYQKVAKESGCRFVLTDLEAVAVMRRPCAICGVAAPEVGHGITRLGHVDQPGSHCKGSVRIARVSAI
jgi:hypothetical protein